MRANESKPSITILTGPRGAGKTTLVLRLTQRLGDENVPHFGVVTPKELNDGQVVGINVADLSTGEQVPFAARDPGVCNGPWRFLPEGIAFADRACNPQTHDGLAVIDEIGPLEFKGQGFVGAFNALVEGRYPRALVVVRPALIDAARKSFQGLISEIDCTGGDVGAILYRALQLSPY